MRLDYVLALKTEDFMERRLQTQVFKSGLAKSVHHARVLIRQRHIRVGKQVVNVPSFVVRLESQSAYRFPPLVQVSLRSFTSGLLTYVSSCLQSTSTSPSPRPSAAPAPAASSASALPPPPVALERLRTTAPSRSKPPRSTPLSPALCP